MSAIQNKLDELVDEIYETIISNSRFNSIDWLFDVAAAEMKEYIKELRIADEITASEIWNLFDEKYDFIYDELYGDDE